MTTPFNPFFRPDLTQPAFDAESARGLEVRVLKAGEETYRLEWDRKAGAIRVNGLTRPRRRAKLDQGLAEGAQGPAGSRRAGAPARGSGRLATVDPGPAALDGYRSGAVHRRRVRAATAALPLSEIRPRGAPSRRAGTRGHPPPANVIRPSLVH